MLSRNKYKLTLRFAIKAIVAFISTTKMLCCEKKNSLFFSNLKRKFKDRGIIKILAIQIL